MKYYFFILIIYLQSCKTYEIDKEAVAQQLSNLRIIRKKGVSIDFSTGKDYGGTGYSSNLEYLIIKKDSLKFDTVVPLDIKFFFKAEHSPYLTIHSIIFKENFFISFNDTSLKTSPKCKFCKVHIDSIEKIIIRGSRINKIKKNK